MSEQTPSGWYPDPDNSAQQRYWNGTEWTDDYAPAAAPQAPPQPPKKGGVPTGVKVLIGIVGVLVLMGACGALLSGGETETPTAQATQSEQAADEDTTPAAEAPAAEEETPAEEPVVEEETPEEPTLTVSQENALGSADDYLAYQAFSKKGLIEQLEFEGYSTKDATFAANNVQVNWNEQAAKAAEQYLEFQNFSRSGLIEQLEFEGYTTKQAIYGVNQTGL